MLPEPELGKKKMTKSDRLKGKIYIREELFKKLMLGHMCNNVLVHQNRELQNHLLS